MNVYTDNYKFVSGFVYQGKLCFRRLLCIIHFLLYYICIEVTFSVFMSLQIYANLKKHTNLRLVIKPLKFIGLTFVIQFIIHSQETVEYTGLYMQAAQ
jgi:hypothetical protein